MAILSGLLSNYKHDNNAKNQRKPKLMLFLWTLLVFASMSVSVDAVPEKNKKKFYAIHIGPSKTGTTAIQTDSGRNPALLEALRLDGAAYLGKYSRKSIAFSKLEPITLCMINIYLEHWKSDGSRSAAKLLRQRLINDCWGKNNEHYLQTSIVDSNEGYSYNNRRTSLVLNHIDVLRTILVDYFDYDEVIVIGTYRPYAEWLTSVYKENTRQTCLSSDLWPWEKPTKRNIFQDNKACANLWNFTKLQVIDRGIHQYNAQSHAVMYLNIDVTLGEQQKQRNMETKLSGVDVKILHLYFRYGTTGNHNGYNSITTEFYCNALGETRTPNACHFSRDRDTSSNATFNQGNSFDAVWFDDILIAAAHHGLLRDAPLRLTARDRLMEYYERELELEASNERTISMMKANNTHLPLACPTQTELEILLKKSLEFEELIKTKFSLQELKNGNSNGDDDGSSMEAEASEHTRIFWKMANEKKAFCWVDTQKLFLPGENSNNNANASYEILANFWGRVFRKAFSEQYE